MDSQISISLSFEVYQGGMICVVCDVQISNCTLVFVAIGKYVSGILIEAKETVTVKDTSIQYRVTSQHSSGLVNLLNSSSVVIQIQDCTLTGSNLQDSAQSGYIAASVLKPLVIRISRFAVCVDGIQRIGGLEAAATFEGTESLRCDVCGVQKMVYGLCAEALENGKLVGGIIKCEHPFQFVNNRCKCGFGYILDDYKCINITQAINNISQQNHDISLLKLLKKNITDMENQIDSIENQITQNISQIKNNLQIIQQELEIQILQNITDIRHILLAESISTQYKIQDNIQILDNIIIGNFSAIERKLVFNASEIEKRLFNKLQFQDLIIY
ncbi:Hypothetical_protein [Hexamita inflata]|uniref:Hypothetical_protein n=1 Tax=Hexamita inflata TaxID=28002 RepID=A0AA86RDQ4_9EUKA|nr:Hypothetical protein HINF_LOCUS64009 [Hexamita inflata]